MAEIATGNRDDALELVQEAMLALASKYGDRNTDEWGPLFQRILQSKIRDSYRRQRVRSRVITLLSSRARTESDTEAPDPLESIADGAAIEPDRALAAEAAGEAIVRAVSALPLRQQQTFLLRQWEGLGVAETAAALGISSGSVKTHLTRALRTLRQSLEEHRL